MSWEFIIYNEARIDSDGELISWMQKFLERYFLTTSHPEWFAEVIDDLQSNFFMPLGKSLLDYDLIGEDKERFDYYISLLDKAIVKLESMSKRDFFSYIRDDLRGSWVDLDDSDTTEEWLDDNSLFDKDYINMLREQKKVMYEQHGYKID